MDNRDEVRDFLTTRRAKVSPQQAGLTAGSNRRVPGLRRAEVAMLADISIEYYSRIERGDIAGTSEAVLETIAGALQLDDAERQHLFDLARAAGATPSRRARRTPRSTSIRPGLQLVLDAVTAGPALVRNGRMDIIGTNRLARAMYSDMFPDVIASPDRVPNLARYAFLDRERSERFYPDWDLAADQTVAILRIEAGRDPYDTGLQELIGELSTRSADFRAKWGAHDVRRHATGEKHFHHAVVGPLDFVFEAADLVADPGLNLLIYTAEPGSRTAEALQLLASWAATRELEQAAAQTNP